MTISQTSFLYNRKTWQFAKEQKSNWIFQYPLYAAFPDQELLSFDKVPMKEKRWQYLQSYDPSWLTVTESHDSKCAGNSLHFILVMQTRNIESWCRIQSSLPAAQAVLSGLNYHFADSDDLLQPNNAVQLSNQKLEKTKILTSEFSYQKIEVIK